MKFGVLNGWSLAFISGVLEIAISGDKEVLIAGDC